MGSGLTVLVGGTGDEAKLDEATREAAVKLGRMLAQAGHRLVTCGWPGVDLHVGAAFRDAVRARGEEPRDRLRQVMKDGRAPLLDDGEIVRVPTEARETRQSSELADVIVLLGGVAGTRDFFDIGGEKRPVLPLPRTGGVAAEVFAELTGGAPLPAHYKGLRVEQLRGLDVVPSEAVTVALRWIDHLAAASAPAPPPAGGLDPENERAFERLVAELRNPGLMAFVGAGLSVGCGYPLWGKLLERLAEGLTPALAATLAGEGLSPLVRAERLRDYLGKGPYEKRMRELFDSHVGAPGALHADLLALPLTHLVTTNYDDLLERAQTRATGDYPPAREWTTPSEIHDFLAAARRRHQERRFVHLHGVWSRPENLVLTLSDYEARYHRSESTRAMLSAVLSAYPFLFAGFSFTDLEVMGVFHHTLAALQIEVPQHYALLSIDPRKQRPDHVREELRRRFRIDPIFFEETPDFAGLGVLVRRLLDRTRGPERLPPPEKARLVELSGRQERGEPNQVPAGFHRETAEHDLLRSLRKKGLIRPASGGSWQAGEAIVITPLGEYELGK